MRQLILHRSVRVLTAATLGLGLAVGAAAGAQASITSKTAGCKPLQDHTARPISATATATPYHDRWITRKLVVSGTKSYGDAGQHWDLKSITISGYPTVDLLDTSGAGATRITRYTDSKPRTITVSWKRNNYLWSTVRSCTVKSF